MYESIIQECGPVSFPEFRGERHYMVPFYQKEGLPLHLEHWQKTIAEMLQGIQTDNLIYLMIDQSRVEAGDTQRRPGVHVDGYWNPFLSSHQGGHTGRTRHKGYGGHTGNHMAGGWDVIDFSNPEALILASDVSASQAFAGKYEGTIGDGGDCSSINLEGLSPVRLKGGFTYAGTVSTLHESLPVAEDCYRTLVRLNCPGVSIH